eukprot:scaffold10267_cov116-Isochrysis_galbana.AAC.1
MAQPPACSLMCTAPPLLQHATSTHLVKDAQLVLLRLVHHGEHTSNGFADKLTATGEGGRRATHISPVHSMAVRSETTTCDNYTHQRMAGSKPPCAALPKSCAASPPPHWRRHQQRAHILESLEAAPPVTLATRKEASSDLSSSSCLVRSVFVLVRSSCTLTFMAAEGRAQTGRRISGQPHDAAAGLTTGCSKSNGAIDCRAQRLLRFCQSHPAQRRLPDVQWAARLPARGSVAECSRL